MTKEEIGQEIAKWYLHDGPYCYTLVAMAHEEGLLSDAEATAAKEDLDKVYEHDSYHIHNASCSSFWNSN